VQLFPRLMFDRTGIALEPVDVAFQQVIFTLQVLHLLVKPPRLLPFLFVDSQPIRSKDNVISDRNRQRCGSHSRSFSPPDRDARPHGAHRV